MLLVDAMIRAKYVARQVGGFALFVDAKDEATAGFYAHFGFEHFLMTAEAMYPNRVNSRIQL